MSNKKLRVFGWIILALPILLIVVLPLLRGYLRHREIMNIIDKAKIIKIVEHSNKRDEVDKIAEYKEKIYKEVEIQPGQFEVVKKAFPISLDYTGIIEFGCLYDTHHRIEIIQKDGNAATIEICFICGDMCVNQGKINQMPIGWKNSLKVLMGKFGMHTDEYSFRKLKHKNSEPSAATNALRTWLSLDGVRILS